MSASAFSFKKKEKLTSRKVIESLFASGRSFVKYPFRIVFLPLENGLDAPVKVLVSVSKKRFKRANKRNLLKRRIREAYRLNKNIIYGVKENISIAVAFVYLPQEIMEFNEIEKGMKKSLENLRDKLKES